MSYKKSDYFDFCEWALKHQPDLSDIDLSRSFTNRDGLYMQYLGYIFDSHKKEDFNK